MKNHKIFAKRALCGVLSAALVSFGAYTAAFAENEKDITPAAEQTEGTATPSPSPEAAATEAPETTPSAAPTAAPSATPEAAKLTLRVNAKVYKVSNGVYRVVFTTGSSLPSITGFEFTALFDDAVVTGSDIGDSLKNNGEFSRSVRDDNEITFTWKNGEAPISGAVTLCSATVETKSTIKASNLSLKGFTAVPADGSQLEITPDLGVSDGADVPTLSDEEKKVYERLIAVPAADSMSFFKDDGTIYNDISSLYLEPANSALTAYDTLTDSSQNNVDNMLKANGSSIISVNAAYKTAEALNSALGVMNLSDAYYGISDSDTAVNYEYLKRTSEKTGLTAPAYLENAPKAYAQFDEAVKKIGENNKYVESALAKISDSTYENYNTRILSLSTQLASANRFSEHPYYAEYLDAVTAIANELYSDVNTNYSGSYKEYMLKSINDVLSEIKSGSEVLKNLPTFEAPKSFTIGRDVEVKVTRAIALENQSATAYVDTYKDGALVQSGREKAFADGSRSVVVQVSTNVNTLGRNGGTVVFKVYYKFGERSYYLGEQSLTAYAPTVDTTFGTNGSGGSSSGWGNEGTGSGGGTTAPDNSDRPTPAPESTQNPGFADDNPYTDIDGYDWAKEAIIGLTNAGIVNGMGDGEFNPAGNVTREQFCKMVVQMYGLDATDTATTFSDVDTSAWYAPYVTAAVNAGFVQGQSDDYFGIGESIMRQDMATILYRAIDLKGEMAELNFTDNDSIAEYAKDAVSELVGLGIMNGYEDGSFKPRGSATRAEAAKVIWGIYNIK